MPTGAAISVQPAKRCFFIEQLRGGSPVKGWPGPTAIFLAWEPLAGHTACLFGNPSSKMLCFHFPVEVSWARFADIDAAWAHAVSLATTWINNGPRAKMRRQSELPPQPPAP